MKFNFKKIATVLGSALMVGSTMGLAAAANYPQPFVQSGAGDVAVVIGANSLDMAYATTITSDLSGRITVAASTGISGGDSVAIDKAATKFQYGKGILDIVSGTLTGDDLSTILADGKYLDDDNDNHDYTQKIGLANLTLGLFDDSDYKQDVPTLGLTAASGAFVLNYSLEFSNNPEWADLTSTDLNIMGKEYFISSVTTNTTINLLDAANTEKIAEGENKQVIMNGKTYAVSVNAFSGTASAAKVKLTVDGETTNALSAGQTYKLSSGVYVGVKEVSMRDVAGTTASAEFSIGTGKIELRHGLPVRINDVTVNGFTTYFTNPSSTSPQQLNKIVLEWKADTDLFAATDTSMVMPGLSNVKISYTGMKYPAEETIRVEKGSNTYVALKAFPLKGGDVDIDLVYGNGTVYQGTGREATKMLQTAQGAASTITFDSDEYQYFVASYDDGLNSESYLVRANSFGVKSDGVTNTTDIQYWNNGAFTSKKAEAANGDVINLGSVSLTIGAIHRTNHQVAITGGTSVYFDRVFSNEGLKVFLPIANVTANYTASGVPVWPNFATNGTAAGYNGTVVPSTYQLGFVEESRTEATTGGRGFNATLAWTSSKTTVSDVVGENPDGGYEIGSTDVMRSFVQGALASELLFDTSGDQDSLEITYHGAESYGQVYVAEVSATTGGSAAALQPVYDTAISSVSSKNLIVIGGSCINSVAAKLLGSNTPMCGPSFTTASGVGAGQFIIKSYDATAAGGTAGKVALLVAGYDAADTEKAATYLKERTVNTAIGSVVKKTSATYADIA